VQKPCSEINPPEIYINITATEPSTCHRALYLLQSPLSAAEPSICGRALYLWQSPLPAAEPFICGRVLYLSRALYLP